MRRCEDESDHTVSAAARGFVRAGDQNACEFEN
jgi:hypothetical protein